MSELGIFYPEKGYKKTTENFTGTLGTIINAENFEEMENKIRKGYGNLQFRVSVEGQSGSARIKLESFGGEPSSIEGSACAPFISEWICVNYNGEYIDGVYSYTLQIFSYTLSNSPQINDLSNLISSSTECTLDIIYYE